jgi:hypothetical protein
MGVLALTVRGQLDPVTAPGPGAVDRRADERATDARAAVVGVDMHRLDLGTEASLGLEMSEDQQLTESDHFAAPFGHQDHATRSLNLRERALVAIGVCGVLGVRSARQGTGHQELDEAG